MKAETGNLHETPSQIVLNLIGSSRVIAVPQILPQSGSEETVFNVWSCDVSEERIMSECKCDAAEMIRS